MTTVLAFVLALGLLIAIHEYGHYRVAVACGIKVLRFSIGFGRPVLRWRLRGNPTEFVIGLLPLGGYVRMLDEREAPVEASQRHLAFNTQPLRSRVAVVAAGPLANLLLAAVLYATVSWIGVEEPQAVVSTPAAGSVAERAGLRSGDWGLHLRASGCCWWCRRKRSAGRAVRAKSGSISAGSSGPRPTPSCFATSVWSRHGAGR
jgi:regulator of sigma E protease